MKKLELERMKMLQTYNEGFETEIITDVLVQQKIQFKKSMKINYNRYPKDFFKQEKPKMYSSIQSYRVSKQKIKKKQSFKDENITIPVFTQNNFEKQNDFNRKYKFLQMNEFGQRQKNMNTMIQSERRKNKLKKILHSQLIQNQFQYIEKDNAFNKCQNYINNCEQSNKENFNSTVALKFNNESNQFKTKHESFFCNQLLQLINSQRQINKRLINFDKIGWYLKKFILNMKKNPEKNHNLMQNNPNSKQSNIGLPTISHRQRY